MADDFPPDLPSMIEWRLPGRDGRTAVLKSLPRRAVRSVSSSGVTDAVIVHPQIPIGAKGWRIPGETRWRPMESLPTAWLPFVDRQRGTAMDPRPPLQAEAAAPRPQTLPKRQLARTGDLA